MEDLSNLYDVIIVGGGPAGLSAAIYMARAKYKVLVLEQEKMGGQITITDEVVNYPGVYRVSGTELTETMQKQGQSFGAEFQFAQVTHINTTGQVKIVHTSKGDFRTLGVILALGANPRKLGFEGETEFQGNGVAYCATCDGEFFKGMEVYVIGGGFAAVEEGIFLTKYASTVHIVLRGDSFSCAKTVADKALNHPKIQIHYNSQVEQVAGTNRVNSITLKNKESGELTKVVEEKGLGVFVFAGYVPNTSWLPWEITKKDGYIVTSELGETNVTGIYAAGDVCIKQLRQVVTAVSDGATAATSLEKYVEQLHHDLELPELLSVSAPKSQETVQNTENSGEQGFNYEEFEAHRFIDGDMMTSLAPVIAKLDKTVLVRTAIAQDDLGEELEIFAQECQKITPKIQFEILKTSQDKSYLEVCKENTPNAEGCGVRYEAVPGGHEFTSFLKAVLAMSGVGKEVEELARIQALKPVDMKVFITLSCSKCPDVVSVCQQIAMHNSATKTTILDAMYAPTLREKYNIMSVPCLVLNDEVVHFGKKSMTEILDLVEGLA